VYNNIILVTFVVKNLNNNMTYAYTDATHKWTTVYLYFNFKIDR